MNTAFVCPNHAPKPDPELAKRDPASLVGKFVKTAFTNEGWTEHMWVAVTHVEGTTLHGTLDNDPIGPLLEKCGDQVVVQMNEIEEVLDE
jgi:uncharacterized protein YegJ (DUF2314 family)